MGPTRTLRMLPNRRDLICLKPLFQNGLRCHVVRPWASGVWDSGVAEFGGFRVFRVLGDPGVREYITGFFFQMTVFQTGGTQK